MNPDLDRGLSLIVSAQFIGLLQTITHFDFSVAVMSLFILGLIMIIKSRIKIRSGRRGINTVGI